MRISVLFVFLMFLPFSSASIDILDGLEDTYNLGDDISFSVKVIPEDNMDGLIRLTMKCTEREVSYYTVPLELESGVEQTVDVPEIRAFTEGLCNIRINLESLEGDNLDGATSDDFTVTSLLDLSFSVDKEDVLPGDEIRIEGSAGKRGREIESGRITIKIGNKKGEMDLKGKEFSYKFDLDEDIQSGEHTIVVEVSDSYGNYGEEGVVIDVEAVPTTFELYKNGDDFYPQGTLEFMAYLLDQGGNPMDEEVSVKLSKKKTMFKDEVVIFDTSVRSNMKYNFGFNQSTLPYEYTLSGVFGDIEKEDKVTILEYPRIDIRMDGDKVIVRNIGNVKYNNDTTIFLESDGKKYLLNKKIKLDVGEALEIDLSKEVETGTYTVTVPESTVEERVVEKVVEVPTIVEKEVPRYVEQGFSVRGKTRGLNANIFDDVEIQSNMPLYRKFLNWITGMAVGRSGILLRTPRYASLIMILIILGIVGYFNRERIGKFFDKIKDKREKKF